MKGKGDEVNKTAKTGQTDSSGDTAHKTTLIKFINTLLYTRLGEKAKAFLESTTLTTEKGIANNAIYVRAIDDFYYKKDSTLLNHIINQCEVKLKIFGFHKGHYVLSNGLGVVEFALPAGLAIPTEHLKNAMSMSDFIAKALGAGFPLVDVPGDGHCFYHAVAYQLRDSLGIGAAELHRLALAHIVENQDQYLGFMTGPNPAAALQAYIDTHARSTTWADSLIIQALANAINININVAVFDANGTLINTLNIQPFAGPAGQTVHIANLNNVHFLAHVHHEPVQETVPPEALGAAIAPEALSAADVGKAEPHTTAVGAASKEQPKQDPGDDEHNSGGGGWFGGWFSS